MIDATLASMGTVLHLAVLGDPIEHSRSPVIHRAAMDHLGIEGTYRAIRSGPPELADAVDRLRDGSFDGINVTMPLKAEAARLADALTDEAADSGSVNTMRVRDGIVEGHSTDVVASSMAFGDARFDSGAPILVLGAGGAAAAAIVGAGTAETYVAARDPQRAQNLVERLGSRAGVIPFGAGVAGALVVNATPLGMSGDVLPRAVTLSASGLIDLAYGGLETPAVTAARDAGLPVMDGVEFLVLQAAGSFEWWTGLEAPFEVMIQAARKV
jgi:shikimate dehydrogenase